MRSEGCYRRIVVRLASILTIKLENMGTLVEKPKKKAANKSGALDLVEEETKEQRKLEKRIDKEFSRIRGSLEEVRQALSYVESATSHDDVAARLKILEKKVKYVRKGSAFSRGANSHSRLLRKLAKVKMTRG